MLLVLLLRRPPVVALLFPDFRRRLGHADTVFIAWFGPVGIAAIYYATFARGQVHDPMVWHAASAVTFAPIIAHGLTAVTLARLYARCGTPAPIDTPAS